MKIFFLTILVVFILWILASYIAVRTIEEPQFTVLQKSQDYEIRNYSSYIVAEVEVDGDQKQALNQGFRLLAGYIFGGNTSQESISMTAPVSETTLSEKIAMTIPVSESLIQNGTRKITFSMPSTYTLATLPKPDDVRVQLKEVGAEKRAVFRYSWGMSESRVASKKQALQSSLERDKLSFTGAFSSHFYNPPFTIPFMRRNEVSVAIIQEK